MSASFTTGVLSRPTQQKHIEAAANIRAYLNAVEGSSGEETESALKFAGSMMAQMQRRKSWSADASLPRDQDMHLIYGPRPRTSSERLLTEVPFAKHALIDKKERSTRVSALPLLDTDNTKAPRVKVVDETWSTEGGISRDRIATASTTAGMRSHTNPPKRSQTQTNQLPFVAPEKRQQGFSLTSKKQTSSTTTNQQHSRHTSRPGQVSSRSRNENGSQRREERMARENIPAVPKKQPHSRMRRPETPEQALAKLVSPSELNAALPAQRDRRITPAEHLGDALAGTWGHIFLPSGGVHSFAGSRTSKVRGRDSGGRDSGVVRRRWEPFDAAGEENIPFVKLLEKKYGVPPEPKQRSRSPDVEDAGDSASEAVLLVEISEQERMLMGALGMKYDDRKHVP